MQRIESRATNCNVNVNSNVNKHNHDMFVRNVKMISHLQYLQKHMFHDTALFVISNPKAKAKAKVKANSKINYNNCNIDNTTHNIGNKLICPISTNIYPNTHVDIEMNNNFNNTYRHRMQQLPAIIVKSGNNINNINNSNNNKNNKNNSTNRNSNSNSDAVNIGRGISVGVGNSGNINRISRMTQASNISSSLGVKAEKEMKQVNQASNINVVNSADSRHVQQMMSALRLQPQDVNVERQLLLTPRGTFVQSPLSTSPIKSTDGTLTGININGININSMNINSVSTQSTVQASNNAANAANAVCPSQSQAGKHSTRNRHNARVNGKNCNVVNLQLSNYNFDNLSNLNNVANIQKYLSILENCDSRMILLIRNRIILNCQTSLCKLQKNCNDCIKQVSIYKEKLVMTIKYLHWKYLQSVNEKIQNLIDKSNCYNNHNNHNNKNSKEKRNNYNLSVLGIDESEFIQLRDNLILQFDHLNQEIVTKYQEYVTSINCYFILVSKALDFTTTKKLKRLNILYKNVINNHNIGNNITNKIDSTMLIKQEKKNNEREREKEKENGNRNDRMHPSKTNVVEFLQTQDTTNDVDILQRHSNYCGTHVNGQMNIYRAEGVVRIGNGTNTSSGFQVGISNILSEYSKVSGSDGASATSAANAEGRTKAMFVSPVVPASKSQSTSSLQSIMSNSNSSNSSILTGISIQSNIGNIGNGGNIGNIATTLNFINGTTNNRNNNSNSSKNGKNGNNGNNSGNVITESKVNFSFQNTSNKNTNTNTRRRNENNMIASNVGNIVGNINTSKSTTSARSNPRNSVNDNGNRNNKFERGRARTSGVSSNEINIRPFSCPFDACSKTFKMKQHLQVHIRTHTGEQPYVCQINGCGRKFTQISSLRRHARTHTGEKPFVCNIDGCKKRFSQKVNLKVHQQSRIHKQKPKKS